MNEFRTRFVRRIIAATVAQALVLAFAFSASADFDIRHSGSVEADLRLVVDKNRGAVKDEPLHFNWNRNAADYKLTVFAGENVRGVAHARAVFFGVHKVDYMGDTIDREKISPFRLESDAIFIDVKNFLFENLDISAGRQVINWGSADMFNPTNNLNPYDLEDPMQFGKKLANQMASITYTFPWLDWSIQAVFVPTFRPSLLPYNAPLALSDANQMPVREKEIKEALLEERDREEKNASVFLDPVVRVNTPKNDLNNVSGGVRTKLTLGDFDLSASYYYGRSPFPVPKRIYAYSGADIKTEDGIRTEQRSYVDVIYPRMMVVGFDMAASLPWLFGLGVWFEGTAYHPERVQTLIYSTNYKDGDQCAKPGDRGTDIRLVCSESTDKWFFKATAGMDYSFTSWLYGNLQYIHGFVDEFGYEGVLNDYLVGGFDLKFLNDDLLIRIFTIFSITDQSDVLYPVISYRISSAELQLGGLVFLGKEDSKFGQKATGRDWVFTKVTVSF